jgi:hypothetical protein
MTCILLLICVPTYVYAHMFIHVVIHIHVHWGRDTYTLGESRRRPNAMPLNSHGTLTLGVLLTVYVSNLRLFVVLLAGVPCTHTRIHTASAAGDPSSISPLPDPQTLNLLASLLNPQPPTPTSFHLTPSQPCPQSRTLFCNPLSLVPRGCA